jgi:homoserine kinase type II
MAVFTPVSEDAARAFLEEYEIGALEALEPIAEGVENTNYKLTAGGRGFVLTLFEKRTRAEDLPAILGLTAHLATQGFPAPGPVPRKDGALLGAVRGRPATIITWAPGVWLRDPSLPELERAGAALGDLHRLSDDAPPMHPNPFGPAAWRRLAEACAAKSSATWDPLIGALTEEVAHLSEIWPAALPAGAIHADYFPDNVLFHEGRVSGVIDFYFGCRDARAYDLAIAINAWCYTAAGGFRADASAAFCKGYAARRPLSPDERAALPTLCRGAAARFTLTRLYDVLHADPNALVRLKDPNPFAARLRHHAGVADAGAYGL